MSINDISKEMYNESMQIGKFKSNSVYDYRTQFYHLFKSGNLYSTKNHRKNLIAWFSQKCNGEYVRLYVNRPHTIQIKDDKVLNKLLKDKIIRQDGNDLTLNIRND